MPDTARPLSPNQTTALTDPARIVVVEACPGSGKTRLFVEKALREIIAVQQSRKGVAVLSFTNAATDEIQRRLEKNGFKGVYPHYIGTLDSFFLRFVIQPFGSSLGLLPTQGLSLIPAELVQRYKGPNVPGVQITIHDRPGLHECDIISWEPPQCSTQDRYGHRIFLDENMSRRILEAKVASWRASGNVTHSDSHVLSSAILTMPTMKDKVSSIILRRFPLILVDEFQDTLEFHAQALKELMKRSDARGFIVGDPDQAIFNWSGARPENFQEIYSFDGVNKQLLPHNFRSAQKICDVVTHIAPSGIQMSGKLPSEVLGKVILLEHDWGNAPSLSSLGDWLRSKISPGERVAIIARENQTISRLQGIANSAFSCPIESTLAVQLQRIGLLWNQRENKKAATSAWANLGFLLFQDPKVQRTTIENSGINSRQWKKAIRLLILESAKADGQETWDQWRERMKITILTIASNLGRQGQVNNLSHLLARRGNDLDEARPSFTGSSIQSSWPLNTEFLTVHSAKGREFEVVLYLIAPSSRQRPCPSSYWFQQGSGENQEERRIAYVAMTRAIRLLVLCMHSSTAENIRSSAPSGFLSNLLTETL